ncbi:hypothetical protein ACOMHN_026917 [Nucella lapillus]
MVPAAASINTYRHRHCTVPKLAGAQVLQTQLDKGSEKEGSGGGEDVSVTQATAADMPRGKPLLPVHSHDDGDDKSPKSLPFVWYLALAFMVCVYGSYGVLMNLSKEGGKIPYSSSALNFLIESIKFAVAATLLVLEVQRGGTFQRPSLHQALPFAVPGVLYSINNNLSVFMQVHMDPATYQVLGNLKIVTTAVLYRLILKRPLKAQQWISVGLLTSAGFCDSIGNMVGKGQIDLKEQYITATGLFAILTYCLISALAGVYSEFILKKDLHTSLHLQNMMLYSFSISLNFAAWFFSQGFSESSEVGAMFQLFKGFSVYTWLIILTQAFNGLGMSVVFKHGSNLVRLFVISCAMVVSTSLAIIIFGVHLSVLYFITLFLVIIAIYLYYQ